jgi:hypothetical protein
LSVVREIQHLDAAVAQENGKMMYHVLPHFGSATELQ